MRRLDHYSGDPWGGGSEEPARPPEPDVPPGVGAFLRGLLTSPRPTVVRARGRRYWGAACTVSLVVGLLLLRTADLAYDVAVLPLLIVVGLMATFPLAGLVRLVSGGRDGIADATASQVVLVAGLLVLPAAAVTLADADRVDLALLVLGLAGAAVATVAIAAAAFDCAPTRAGLGVLAAVTVAVVVVVLGVELVAALQRHAAAMVYGDG